MAPSIEQSFNGIRQKVRMCIESDDQNIQFTGDYFKAVRIAALEQAQAKIAELESELDQTVCQLMNLKSSSLIEKQKLRSRIAELEKENAKLRRESN